MTISEWTNEELGEWLAEHLMRWTRCQPNRTSELWWYRQEKPPHCRVADWRPATDPTTALRDVVPAMIARNWWPRWMAPFYPKQDFQFVRGNALCIGHGESKDSSIAFAQALCRAAVVALQSEVNP